MSAVIHCAVASRAVRRWSSLGRRGVGTSSTAWEPAAPHASAAFRSRHNADIQSRSGSTSSSRKHTQRLRLARQPTLQAAAGPRPPLRNTRTGGSSGSGRPSPGRGRSSTTTTSGGCGPMLSRSAISKRRNDSRPTVGITSV